MADKFFSDEDKQRFLTKWNFDIVILEKPIYDKEQAVAPVPYEGSACPRCNRRELEVGDDRCPGCNQKIDWMYDQDEGNPYEV